MKIIQTDNELKPKGHYSQAIIHNGILYISGQIAVDPDTGKDLLGTPKEETERILKNIDLILKEAGTTKDNVIKATVYIPDMKYWDEVNEEYAKYFGDHKPARAIVPTGDLHNDFQVEIEMMVAV
ncbi:MAG: RidA family protein [Tissierellales bacterium]|jgi:reactive intermediate/imine deaminase|nr:RidA family protein [Tissierellales bacterium]HCX02900.1 enamine deaminase RidA [Clostridiales bacterium]